MLTETGSRFIHWKRAPFSLAFIRGHPSEVDVYTFIN